LYTIAPGNVTDIQREILEYGPVTAGLEVFTDFLTYSEGIYYQTTDQVVGAHAITLIGWGTEDGIPYWIAENQWSSSWGELGYVRILQGTDEVGIESYVHGGRPNATGVIFPELMLTAEVSPTTATSAAEVTLADVFWCAFVCGIAFALRH
jgi:hypothetical protein